MKKPPLPAAEPCARCGRAIVALITVSGSTVEVDAPPPHAKPERRVILNKVGAAYMADTFASHEATCQAIR